MNLSSSCFLFRLQGLRLRLRLLLHAMENSSVLRELGAPTPPTPLIADNCSMACEWKASALSPILDLFFENLLSMCYWLYVTICFFCEWKASALSPILNFCC